MLNRRVVCSGSAVVIALAVATQVDAQTPDTVALSKIRTEALERSQLIETLSYLTDVFGGRVTNSPAAAAAAEWAQTRLRRWEIESWREHWGPFGQGWTNELASVHVVSPHPFPIIVNVEAWTPGTKGEVRGPAMLVPDLHSVSDFDRYRDKLRDAFVLLDSMPSIDPPPLQPLATRHTPQDLLTRSWPYPPQPPLDSIAAARRQSIIAQGRAKIEFRTVQVPRFLAAEGAIAIVNASDGSGGTVFLGRFGERQGSPQQPAPLPSLTFASEHYGRIARMLAKGIPVTLQANVRNIFTGSRNDSAFNILAEIQGTDKADEVVMLGAHFDSFHFATGATDNGVNVVTMMEAMRILKVTGVPLRRTVRLALWTGEEQGLLGSRAYVHEHFVDSSTHRLKSGYAKLAAYYNLDNGGGAIRGPMVDQNSQLSFEADSTFRVWSQALRGLGIDIGIVSPRGGGGTDHVSFYAEGLPGYQFLQDWLDYESRTHHSNMDTFERVVPEDVRRNAAIVASFVFLTANRDRPLPRMRTW